MFLCNLCLTLEAREAFTKTFFFLWKPQVVVKDSNIYPKDVEAPASGVEDMTRLAYLHEPGVLQNLQSRYDINEIYVSNFTEIYLLVWVETHVLYMCTKHKREAIASPCYLRFVVRLNPRFTFRHIREAY